MPVYHAIERTSPKGRASIESMAIAQGVDPSRFANSPFSVTELRRAIGNGVPLPMGRAVARAVRAAITTGKCDG
jgi:site-specific DNA-cytosine methylase